ncbi:MAG TPA: PilZ domain-containing protein [Terriglobales bacterium]|nr:PilZ domain-containing protein [Terriglobales bacterium]
MTMKTKQEQRRERRVIATVPVRARSHSAGEMTGHTRDVGSTMRSVFVYLSNRVAVGSEVELVFPIPIGVTPAEDTWVRCRARVMRCEDTDDHNRFGVAAVIESFEHLDHENSKYTT